MALKENMRGLVETVERAFEQPWDVTTAKLLGGEWWPRLELAETEKAVVVSVSLPKDLNREELHLSVTESTLAIRGSHQKGSFYRGLTLPATIRPDDVKASFKNGELKIELPKAKHSQMRRITIG